VSLPEPYYHDPVAGIAIFCGDCREILPLLPDKSVDLVLTDPPYGMNYKPASVHENTIAFDSVIGDAESFEPAFLLRKWALILWGANYYASRLPDSGKWIAWDKRTISGMKVRSSEAEFAWTNCIPSPKIFRFMWAGAFRDGEGRNLHIHPTQKPVELMAWCIHLSGTPQTVLDPFMGSGTTLVAAKQLGRKAIGIEIEEKYCEIAVKRLAQIQLPFPDSQPKRELANLQKLWDEGHPDQEGIKQGMADWIVQDAIDEVEEGGVVADEQEEP